MKKNVGSSFDSWLREEGIQEEVTVVAIRRVLARLEAAMSDGGLSRAEMARRMQTNRSQLDHLLDPENDSVSLTTLQKAVRAIKSEVRLELV